MIMSPNSMWHELSNNKMNYIHRELAAKNFNDCLTHTYVLTDFEILVRYVGLWPNYIISLVFTSLIITHCIT